LNAARNNATFPSMSPSQMPDPEKQAKLLAELRRDQEIHQNTYRARALKLFPHVCGRCKREFSGKRLQELTVHHKDHNFKNNPNDGSNWELLCIYCHEDEHDKTFSKGLHDEPGNRLPPSTIFNPFGALDGLFKQDGDNTK